jgi:TP901 family phage tail tape measure protein
VASATVGILRVLLTANTAEFDDAMKKASDSAKVWTKDLSSIGKQATAVGSVLTKAITLPLLGLGAGAIKMASDFESSFAGVRKTVDATEPEFAQLAQGLRNMAKEIPISVNELNKVAEAAGQLGIKKDDILQFTRTMADLGVTTNLTADEAATATAQIQNIFGAAGKDVDRFGATLVALGNAGASTEKDIINMGLRIAGAGNQVGLSQAQVLSFASALSSVGINAEAGGSAISRVFLKINDAVAVGGGAMNEFARVAGMTGAQFKQAFETDAATATTAFITGLARLKGEGENVNATLENLVGKNIILKDTLLRASGAGSLLTEQLALGNKAWQDNTALVDEAKKRYATFESQAKLLWAQLRDVGITLGTALIPILRDLLTAMQPVISAISTAADGFAKLPQPVRTTMVAVAALAAAIGPLLLVFGHIATGAAAVTAAFTAKGIATRALTALMTAGTAQAGLFGMAISTLGTTAAIAATAFAAWKLGGWIGEVSGATDGVGKLTAKLGEMIGILPQGTAAQYDASRAAATAAQSSTGLATATTNVATTAAAAAPAVQRIAQVVRQSGEVSKEAAKAADQFAASLRSLGGGDALAGAREVQKQLEALGGPLNVLPSQLDSLAAKLREGAQAALLMGNVKLAEEFERLALTLNPMAAFQKNFNVTLGQYVTQAGMAESATQALYDQFFRLTGQLQTIQPVLKNTFKPDFLVPFKGAVTAADTSVQGFFGKFKDAMRETGVNAQSLSSLFQQAFVGGGGALGAIKAFATQGLQALMSMIPGIPPWLTQMAGPIIAGLSKLASKAKDILRGIFGGPDADELAGRELVEGFEDSLRDGLSAAQEAESQGEDWRRTVIAIRDAYIAMGRTEEEALADAERLWESSRQSAEESARVIAEIQRKMRELTDGTHTVDVEVVYRGNAPDGATRPGEPESHTQPVDPGFAGGTMGRFGDYFRNFGKGFPTTLHGVEAVLRPQDVMPFAESVMAGAGSGPTSTTTTNNIFIPMPSEAGGDPRRMADHVLGQLPAAVELDRFDLLTMFESVVHNVIRDHYARG